MYRAIDTKLDRTVAIKVLPHAALTSSDDRARFHREAKAAAQLHHPHIASVFEIDEAAPVPLGDSPYSEWHPALSPDGNRIAFMSDEAGTEDLYVAPFPRMVPRQRVSASDGVYSFTWSYDGRFVFYLNGDRSIMRRYVSAQAALGPAEKMALPDTISVAAFDVFADNETFLIHHARRIGGSPREYEVRTISDLGRFLEE